MNIIDVFADHLSAFVRRVADAPRCSRIFSRVAVGIMAVALLAGIPTVRAIDYVWTDGAGDGLWTSTNNWDSGIVPPRSSVSYVYFGDDGTNTTTSLDDRSVSIGILRFTHPRGTSHTIDLNGETLAIRGEGNIGTLDVGAAAPGISRDCGDVVFTNGTLQIGDRMTSSSGFVNLFASVSIGYTHSTSAPEGRGRMTVYGRFATSNMNSMSIGRVATGSTRDSTDSWLDLSNTTISSPAGENIWAMVGDLWIGRYGSGHGELRLPASLEEMHIGGKFTLGEGTYTRTRGVIDFGSNSQLRALSVEGDFSLGAGGTNELRNWPRSVAVTIGTSESYSACNIGHGGGDQGVDASLIVSNAPFTAFLNDLKVGGGPNSGTTTGAAHYGLLDLEHATSVQIGDTPNQIDCPSISLGYGRYYGYGTLRLPATLTAFAADTLIIGGSRHDGTLAFASGSQLTNLTVRENFMMGSAWTTGWSSAGGTGYVLGLPTNVAIRIGSPEAPAGFSMGDVYQYGLGGLNILAPTNGSFSAHLSTLRMGLNRRDMGSGTRATLDLRETRLDDLVVYGSTLIGSWTNTASGYSDNANGEGRLYLPAGDAEIKGSLHIGDTQSNSYGLLDLTETRVLCGAPVEIGVTGEVIVRMQGESAGLDIASTATNALTVADGGSIRIICSAPPSPQIRAYWGLRMAGDRRVDLQTLADAGALTWDTTALPTDLQTLFRIQYDDKTDQTIVGFVKSGSIIILR